ncbi:hypothetical protein N781_16775 [Pontibacillus halophilus JSM 076056 = DSM 19796]|uniref:Uncharacterized protein n=1 Tax=Pontibacillus halophilus JSM 076056 = DSM 19796 TaxID=1385510 RepID=A0A0A5GMS8_9BACI|nr:hypothetical protein N781_16775 [Pontibacillus halophilus JSM 076056 = DSM 19796]
MDRNKKLNTYIILMLTIGVPLLTIIPQYNLPGYILYTALGIGLVLVVLGLPAALVLLKYKS